MYAQLIDGSPPHDYQKLSRDLHRMIHDSRQMLPLITIDADMTDVSSLEACLRSSLHFFERLPALIIIAINPQQQSLISEQLLQRFELRTMTSLDIDGIKALVERRIAKVSSQPYNMTTEDATKLLQLSQSGQPGALIKILRNSVTGNYDRQTSSLPYEPPVSEIQSPSDNSTQPEIESNVSDDSNEISEVQAAEEGWEEAPGMTEASGFDLDFGILDEPVEEPIEDQEEINIDEIEQEMTDDSYISEDTIPFAGVFGGLRAGEKLSTMSWNQSQKVNSRQQKKGRLSGQPKNPWNFPSGIKTEEEPSDLQESDAPIPIDIHPEELQNIQPNAALSLDASAIETFSRVLAQFLRPSEPALSGSQDLIEQLRALSRPRLTEKEEHVLSIAVLSSLTSSESVVVAEAKGRNISPSDKALLGKLSIKRSRLSQICNRLHKAGILHARMVGRSRMFGLSRSALAQLIAWGIIGGDE